MTTIGTVDALTRRAIDVIDVTDMCDALGITESEARRDLLDAAAAGLLRAERVTRRRVVLRGTFPDEDPREEAIS